jgi:hypothetical protein
MDFEPDHQPPGTNPYKSSSATTVYMVSVFLLLIALFAILHTVSRKEDGRAAAVTDSLRATFQRSGDATGDRSQGGFRLSDLDPEFRDNVIRLFGSFVDASHFSHVEDGAMLRIAVAPEEIFHTGTSTLRADRTELMRRLADMMAATRPRMRNTIGIWLQQPAGHGDEAGKTLAVHRAGAIARDLVAQQVEPGRIGIGVAEGRGESILFVFTATPAGTPDGSR